MGRSSNPSSSYFFGLKRNFMQRKVCLITGATAGIGLVTAQALAQQGATLVLVGRNPEKCAATVEQLKQQSGNSQIDFLVADLALQSEVRRLADQFCQRYRRLDVLINNAGAHFMQRRETAEGIEMTFALNHLSYFLLTHLLLETLKASAPARIVNVASDAHTGAKLDFADLQNRQHYGGVGFQPYAQSKLANILFTYELARRLEGSGVTVNTLHPGFVATNFATNNGWFARFLMKWLLHRFAISPEEGAQTTIYLATSPEVEGVTGKYFVQKKATTSSPASYDQAAARQLWTISAEMTGLEHELH
jgi:NAD(P)-dependent dehydrogenase (short-subunit alcohol dehydrogenase family)